MGWVVLGVKEEQEKTQIIIIIICNMKVIPMVIGTLGTIPKGLGKELEELEIGGQAETIQITLFFKDRPEYWEEFGGLKETCCHTDFSERLSVHAGVKPPTPRKVIIIIPETRRDLLSFRLQWKTIS